MVASTSATSFSASTPSFVARVSASAKSFKNQCDLQIHGQLRRLAFTGLAMRKIFFPMAAKKRFEPFDACFVSAHDKNKGSILRSHFRAVIGAST